MKLILVTIALFIYVGLLSQITIDQNDMPNAGDTIRLSSSFDIGLLNYTETGNNFTWDFSGLFPLSQSVDTFVSVQETHWVYQLVFWGSANLAQPLKDFDFFQGFQVTDVYDFFKNTSSDFRKTGYGVTLNGIPVPNKFQEPDIIFKFPLNPENLDSSLSSYEISIPGIGYSGGWKKRVNHADGWGTLITPYGTFETIRVKSDVIQYDSIYIDSLGIGFPVTRNYTEYKWLGNDFGLPLCTVIDEGLLPTISYIDSVRSLFTGYDLSHKPQSKINIYPNPASQEITIEFNTDNPSDVDILLKSLSGEAVMKFETEKNIQGEYRKTFMIDRSIIKNGLYFIVVKNGNGLYIEKIILY